MKRVLIATCVLVTCAVSLAAQTSPQAELKADRNDVTVQGCLRAGEQPNTFVVANISKVEVKSAMGTSGTAGTAGDAEMTALKGTTLRLIGSPKDVKLTEHVGHTVEISGALAPKDAKSTPPAGAATGAAGTSGAAADMRRLNIKTVKHIAETCTAG